VSALAGAREYHCGAGGRAGCFNGECEVGGGIVLSALRAEREARPRRAAVWIVLVNYSQAVVGALIAAFSSHC